MKSHKELLNAYFLHTEIELENVVHECENRIKYRHHDTADLLELIIADERLQAFLEFRRNVLAVLKIELKEDDEKHD